MGIAHLCKVLLTFEVNDKAAESGCQSPYRFPEFGEGPVGFVPSGPGTPATQREAVPSSRGSASGR